MPAELDEESQRGAENAEIRERARDELLERAENIRAQLSDVIYEACPGPTTKKVLMDARWEQKEARREEKNAQI
jgi:hypothetical protein